MIAGDLPSSFRYRPVALAPRVDPLVITVLPPALGETAPFPVPQKISWSHSFMRDLTFR